MNDSIKSVYHQLKEGKPYKFFINGPEDYEIFCAEVKGKQIAYNNVSKNYVKMGITVQPFMSDKKRDIEIKDIIRFEEIAPEKEEKTEKTQEMTETAVAYLRSRVNNAVRYIETLGDEWQHSEVTFRVMDSDTNDIFVAKILCDND